MDTRESGGSPLDRASPRDLLAVALLGLLISVPAGVSQAHSSDFHQFFAAAQLAGTGHLYEFERIRALETGYMTYPVPCARLPVYAFVFRPLTWLPRGAARALWFLVNWAAIIGSVFLLPFPDRRHAWLALCWSIPLAVALFCGQDTPLFLLFMASGAYLLRQRRDFPAGLAFSLAAGKFHLALALPVFLLATRRYRALAGGAAGGAALLGASLAIEGPGWPSAWLALSRIPEFSGAIEKMPNIYGLTHRLSGGTLAEAVLCVGLLWAVYAVARSNPREIGLWLALAAGLLTSRHAFLYDCLAVLPLAIYQITRGTGALRVWAWVVLLPPVYFLLAWERYSLIPQIAITGFVLASAAALVLRQSGEPLRAATPAS